MNKMETILPRLLTMCICVRVISPAMISHGSSVTTKDVREDFLYTVTIPSFQFFGAPYTTINIQENGVVTFDAIPFGGTSASYTLDKKWISPYGADIGGGAFGNILYETFVSSDTVPVEFVSAAVNSTFTGESFVPTSVVVVTWDNVRLYPSSTNTQENTFQVALATDGTKSYVLFIYDTLLWTPAVIQISAGDNASFHRGCQSTIYDAKFLPSMSQTQCSVEGVLVFRVDQTTWQPAGYSCTASYPTGICPSSDNSNRDERCAA